ncbi:hypothetical protein BDY19DRAFT_890450 [Irpex rosettiformis]|uniref:Uncharacterized protein n=1 Tax=Irpex rosettiformis TaxID=378272 RepID=A0ACB8U4L0_9APHY|nr:hypothetical protein BDY19DRAFT_890450 [Irpex rosettiformis]
MAIYKVLEDRHLTVNKDITQENRAGQRWDIMPWFWFSGEPRTEGSGTWMKEFYRITWLRAKQRRDRWDEEVQQCAADMLMTQNWFTFQMHKWEEKAEEGVAVNEVGKQCFANRQVHMWAKFLERSKVFNIYIAKHYTERLNPLL